MGWNGQEVGSACARRHPDRDGPREHPEQDDSSSGERVHDHDPEHRTSTWRFSTIDETLCTKRMEVLHQMDQGAMAHR